MRWLAFKLLNSALVVIAVLFILVLVTMPQFDAVLKAQVKRTVAEYVMSNPAYRNLPPEKLQEVMHKIYEEYIHSMGLDRPWYVKAPMFVWMLLTFQPLQATVLTTRIIDTGSRNAYLIVLERVPFTVLLFTTAAILCLAIAMPLAVEAARRPGGFIDKLVSAWSIASISMPWWWIGMVAIWLFCYKYPIFLGPDATIDWTNPWQVMQRAALPVLVVGLMSVGVVAYRLRSVLLDVMREDFVVTARAKGLPEKVVMRRYVLRVAAPPLVSIVLPYLVLSVVSGGIITEIVFNWFGLGLLYWQAIMAFDIPVLLVLVYITTLLYVAVRLVLDILYVVLDPRIRKA